MLIRAGGAWVMGEINAVERKKKADKVACSDFFFSWFDIATYMNRCSTSRPGGGVVNLEATRGPCPWCESRPEGHFFLGHDALPH